jgi:outer membrane protein
MTATGLVCLAGVSYFIGTASGENGAPTPPPAHKVGLIDIGHIFNEYDKLKILREEFTADWQESEAQAKAHVQKIQSLQQEMKQFGEGTPEFATREKKFATLTSEFETFKKVTQKDLARKEAKMYHTVYLEVQNEVDALCKQYGFTLVLRFSRDELNSAEPQKLAQGLSRTVIFHRPKDDLTTHVLKRLNESYQQNAGPAAAGAAKKPAAASGIKQTKGQKPGTGKVDE